MTRRGQLVLLAAVALAVVLVPMALAHLQLGYRGDAGATAVDEHPVRTADRMLLITLHDAVNGVARNHSWAERREAVTTVRDRLDSSLSAINRSNLDRGAVSEVTYNGSRATEWATRNCPGGPDRRFGSCVAERGLVVQERDGRTHIVAAAFDVRTAGRTEAWRLTVVVQAGRPG